MAIKGLSTDDICKIISTCAAGRVSVLKFGDLQVSFKSPEELADKAANTPGKKIPGTSPAEAEISDKQHDKMTREAIEREEIRLREEQLAELQITDPLEFERQITSGELENVAYESGDE